MKTRIYLDYNATCPPRPEAVAAMQPWLVGAWNPSSIHQEGQKARAAVERAREALAEAVAADPRNVIFTASGTEANNHILRHTGADALFVSAIEHHSVLKVAEVHTAAASIPLHIIPVDANGVVDAEALEALLKAHGTKQALVSVMAANNETGVLQPVAEVAEIARRYGAMLHCDAAQLLGKQPFTLADLGAPDFLTVSAHKCGGVVGAAAIILGGCMPLAPMLIGGGQELNRRAGTENVPAIVAFGEAVRCFDFAQMQQLGQWRDAMEAALLAAVPDAVVFGNAAPRLPTTSNLALPTIKGRVVENSTLLMQLDLAGIAISTGSACTSGKVERSHVLAAIGVNGGASDATLRSAIRISGGWGTTEADLQAVVRAVL